MTYQTNHILKVVMSMFVNGSTVFTVLLELYYTRKFFLDAQNFLVSSALCPLLWVLVALFVAKVILTDSLKISLWERLILWCFLPKSLAGSVSVLGSGGSWQTNITATNLTTSFIPPFLIVNFPECICLSCITSKYICTN